MRAISCAEWFYLGALLAFGPLCLAITFSLPVISPGVTKIEATGATDPYYGVTMLIFLGFVGCLSAVAAGAFITPRSLPRALLRILIAPPLRLLSDFAASFLLGLWVRSVVA